MFAGAIASAQTGQYAATLAQPTATKVEVLAEGNIWRCEGSQCTLVSEPKDTGSLRACRTLVHKVGQLTSYVVRGKAFESDKLGKCNS
jgi:hypothetical protein